jgi:hypothetical protein
MSGSISPYANYMAPAFIGMKADSMDDNVDTFAAFSALGVGIAVQRTAAGASTIKAGAASAALCVGVSLHDHIVGYLGNYRQYDAVSVLTRGRAWVAVDDPTGVVDGAAAHVTAGTGAFNTTGTIAVTNAVFRSAAIDLLNVDWTTYTKGAVVELHYPNV